MYRRMVDCNATPDARLSLGIARTRQDLEACLALLHDAYVASGFMQPHPSGMRVTPYHALPTTTTLLARFENRVVGTLSIIREGVFGFPMQSIFDLSAVRARPGRIAEISALAIHPDFRGTGGSVLFPLMKFMYEYCRNFFDTRHLVIAVNPRHIEMYESLLFFTRLQAQVVDRYEFVNGAPAVGATLDLLHAPETFREAYDGRGPERNLYRYFTQVSLPNIRFPTRPYYTTNDPVMSPELLDHFFNRRTEVFQSLDDRRRRLLHSLYPEEAYQRVLPPVRDAGPLPMPLRRHRRYSLKCPVRFTYSDVEPTSVELEVIDASLHGFLARTNESLPPRARGTARIQLGPGRTSTLDAVIVRRTGPVADQRFYGFHVAVPDEAWRRCIEDLEARDSPPESAAPLLTPEAMQAPEGNEALA